MHHTLLLFFLLLSCLGTPSSLGAKTESFRAVPVLSAYRSVTLTGFTRARRTMTVTSEVSAACVSITADIGDRILTTTVLADLDTTFTDLDLRRTNVGMDQAASRIAYLQKETNRSRELVRRDTQARADLDRLEQELDQARLALAELQVIRAELTERKSRHTLHAPAGWTVIDRMIEPGEWVAAGTPVAELGDFRTLRIPLSLNPEELTALDAVARLQVLLPDYGLTLDASVFRTTPDFNPRTRKTSLELLITPPATLNRGGVRCEISLNIPEGEHTWLVPETAVYERYETHWVTRGDGSEVRVIPLGTENNGLVRISSTELSRKDSVRVQP